MAVELVRQKILASFMAGIRLEGGTALGFFRTSQFPTSNPRVLMKPTRVFISESGLRLLGIERVSDSHLSKISWRAQH